MTEGRGGTETGDLVVGALSLVRRVVAQVAGSFPAHVDRHELLRAGALGLVEAARRWDPERGVPFEGYAVLRIRGAVLDAARAADWAPRALRTMARRIDAVEQSLIGDCGRRPTETEIADALGLEPAALRRVRTTLARLVPLSLDRPAGRADDAETALVELLVDGRHGEPSLVLEHRELMGYLHDAVDLLSERHRLVILGAFFEERTAGDLARELGVTESRVSQLRAEAIAQLRWGITSQYRSEERVDEVSERRSAYAEAIARARRWDQRFDEERRVAREVVSEIA
ncbi:MAG: sigma-70 family RNA polymerase sigma factor [Actinobacteria bacterium]|uniref:Unannotated protein n=1 Tax=freshwater metagenome TaxID=449393 RepID=A0A6J5YI19_9ZZZZ|nr:sigma-70 family RNA polymerase sigma factor [Actinomycetota bacterium]